MVLCVLLFIDKVVHWIVDELVDVEILTSGARKIMDNIRFVRRRRESIIRWDGVI